jgi:hypothetical protein
LSLERSAASKATLLVLLIVSVPGSGALSQWLGEIYGIRWLLMAWFVTVMGAVAVTVLGFGWWAFYQTLRK